MVNIDGEPSFSVPHHFARICRWGGHSHISEGEARACITIVVPEGQQKLLNVGTTRDKVVALPLASTET